MPGRQDGGKSKHVISMLMTNPHQCQAADLHTIMVVSPIIANTHVGIRHVAN